MLVSVITAIVQLCNHFFNSSENEIFKKPVVKQPYISLLTLSKKNVSVNLMDPNK
ncbi:hypothetical protein PNK_0095 [Candidatus Protochlamydia naegleriophila]|uniref:Uncharacterized protein n=1 Tax=Candidatus Protochlamydia naegleriophila TaxID=389348 RepID=A0A0U5JD00_9BACT|nr:hypothetical protein PNK_0095 [Candidatus Protochlamydia naegleriophila]